MPESAYYFINHSRKEFTCFSNRISICKALANALKESAGWSVDDDIRLGSEGLHDVECLKELDDMRYCIAKLR